MPKVLVTAFDAFGGEPVNPAARAVVGLAGLAARRREGCGTDAGDCRTVELITAEIPTVFGESAARVQRLIDEQAPDVLICVGQAGGAHGIRVERVALNIDSARIADNAGNRPSERPIAGDGPVAYWATIPTCEIVDALKAQGIPAFLSYTAGTFVCNHVFYSACHYAATHGLPTKVGFIHVPYLPEQAAGKDATPSMSEECIRRALDVAIAVAVGKEPN